MAFKNNDQKQLGIIVEELAMRDPRGNLNRWAKERVERDAAAAAWRESPEGVLARKEDERLEQSKANRFQAETDVAALRDQLAGDPNLYDDNKFMQKLEHARHRAYDLTYENMYLNRLELEDITMDVMRSKHSDYAAEAEILSSNLNAKPFRIARLAKLNGAMKIIELRVKADMSKAPR